MPGPLFLEQGAEKASAKARADVSAERLSEGSELSADGLADLAAHRADHGIAHGLRGLDLRLFGLLLLPLGFALRLLGLPLRLALFPFLRLLGLALRALGSLRLFLCDALRFLRLRGFLSGLFRLSLQLEPSSYQEFVCGFRIVGVRVLAVDARWSSVIAPIWLRGNRILARSTMRGEPFSSRKETTASPVPRLRIVS